MLSVNKMKSIKTILILNCLFFVSCISRLGRPILNGVITDFNGNPIKDCSVGETSTDENGEFTLPEIRYNKFLLTEIFQMEAPPLFISETIVKENYEPKKIYAFSTFGGGGRKGSKWNLDTIHLKKVNTEVLELRKSNWRVSANKSMDSIYFIRSNFMDICRTSKCQSFYYDYNQYADNYLSTRKKGNLGENIIRKFINVDFKPDKHLSIEKIIQYGDKNGNWSSNKINDTIVTNGVWNTEKGNVSIESNFNELNGIYKVTEFDYEYMLMVKDTIP